MSTRVNHGARTSSVRGAQSPAFSWMHELAVGRRDVAAFGHAEIGVAGGDVALVLNARRVLRMMSSGSIVTISRPGLLGSGDDAELVLLRQLVDGHADQAHVAEVQRRAPGCGRRR